MSYRQTYLQVVDMVQRGYPRKIIAEYLDLPVQSVNNHIGYARRRGIEVAYDPKAAINIPPHIEAWLKSQTPKGATIKDMIVAILTDAYNEEHDK